MFPCSSLLLYPNFRQQPVLFHPQSWFAFSRDLTIIASYRKSCKSHVPTFSLFLFLLPAIDHNNTANMVVKKQPGKQTTRSLILTNNDAIAYLRMGELDESYLLLSEAVASLQNLTNREQPPKSTPFRYAFQWDDLSYSIANYVLKASEQSGLPFLFQRCITIDMPRKREIRANKLCPYGLCWILHYNLAMVAHLIGIQKAESDKSYLREAKRLYGMVSAVILSRRCSPEYIVLLMGIWNNQGCIYRELGMEEQAETCLDRLRKLLIRTRGCRSELPGWRYFYLNVVSLEERRSVAAPAA
jgi:tetratricopeptide (TPR) repeat protein